MRMTHRHFAILRTRVKPYRTDALRMESHAPAAAPHAVVGLDERV
jgi:hypothetical protein